MLLMSYVDTNKATREDVWFLDSSCSIHMCGKKIFFSDLDENFRETVKLENNSSMNVMRKGNVRLQVNGITDQVITGVFYIPELKNNLVSIRQLQGKGLAILIQRGKCKVYHPKRGLIVETKMLQTRCSFCWLHLNQNHKSVSTQPQKTQLIFGIVDMDI